MTRTREKLADELERRLDDPAYTYTQWATFVEQNLPTILTALREPPEPTAEEVERAARNYHGLWPLSQFDARWHADELARWRAAR